MNFRVADVRAMVAKIEALYAPQALERESLDGLGLSFGDWRFNLRASNTEPLLRLNVEARGKPDLVAEKLAALSALISDG